MSKVTLSVFCIAIALIVLATAFGMVPFTTGISGALFVAGLVYAYIVAKREVTLLSYAVKNRDADKWGSDAPASPEDGGIEARL